MKTKIKTADDLCGSLVRARGYCELRTYAPQIKCKGSLQWGHIISRSYKQIRWNLNNAFCICAAHHMYFTNHPLEWEIVVIEMIGEANFSQLRKLALDYKHIDHGKILYELHQAKKNGYTQNQFLL